MEAAKFWRLLGLATLLIIVLLLIMKAVLPRSEGISMFTMSTMGVLATIVVFGFNLGTRAALSTAKYRFVNVIVMLIFLKMIIGFGLVVWYMKMFEPTDKFFVVPFLLIYVIYTILEVYVLERVAKLKPNQGK